ncbi:MAG: C10 family peptidase [Muribaculaceae bacterium]|nr:C10 family peptidase [Muribaculaceae bacterium]
MHKFYLTLLFIGASISSAMANKISEMEALALAEEFETSINKTVTRSSNGELTASRYDENVYIINNSMGGWMLVSADDRLPRMILGYSTTGNLDPSVLSSSMANIIEGYSYGISSLGDNGTPLGATTRASGNAAPLLGDMLWHQSHPFNALYPYIEMYQSNANAGCVQIAQGMIMNYYKYPKQGRGSNSFVDDGKTYSMDFSKSIYQWDLMKSVYNGDDSKESVEAVSKLIYDIAIANKANFSMLSAASMNIQGIIDFFDYDRSIFAVNSTQCSRQYFEDMLRKSIDEGTPVYIEGHNDMQGGHAFVCDGYDDKGYFHYNLGGETGYFLSNATGYDADQQAYYNIKPNNGGEPRIWAGSSKELYWNSGNNITCEVRASVQVDSKGNSDVAVALEDSNGKISYFIQTHFNSLLFDVKTINFNDKVPDGDYKLYPVYRINNGEWEKICFPEKATDHLLLSVKNGVKSYTNTSTGGPMDSSTVLIEGIYYKFRNEEAVVTSRNTLYNSYSGDVTIPDFITYEGVTYPVTAIDNYAFRDSKLGKVYIGENITSIGYGAFFDTEVGKIEYAKEENITDLGSRAFYNCVIDYLRIPAGVTYLGDLTTSGSCKILDLPSSVNYMNIWAISSEVNKMTDMWVYWTSPTELPDYGYDPVNNYGPLFGDFSKVTLHVPEGCINMYKTDKIWGVFGAYNDSMAGIDSIVDDISEIKVSVTQDGILLNSLPAGETAFVYDQQGMLIGKGKAGDTIYANKGLVIIKAGKTVRKIIL